MDLNAGRMRKHRNKQWIWFDTKITYKKGMKKGNQFYFFLSKMHWDNALGKVNEELWTENSLIQFNLISKTVFIAKYSKS